MIKTKEDKTNNLIYRTFFCKVCGAEIFRTIENKLSFYLSPHLIIHCKEKDCHAKHTIKYIEDEIKFELISFKKPTKGKY